MDSQSDERTGWERNASGCQFDLVESYEPSDVWTFVESLDLCAYSQVWFRVASIVQKCCVLLRVSSGVLHCSLNPHSAFRQHLSRLLFVSSTSIVSSCFLSWSLNLNLPRVMRLHRHLRLHRQQMHERLFMVGNAMKTVIESTTFLQFSCTTA